MSVIDPLKRAVMEAYGDRCPDYDPDCMGCQAWGALDEAERLEARAAALMDGSAVVVPREPTPEMYKLSGIYDRNRFRMTYDAMIAAASQQPEETRG